MTQKFHWFAALALLLACAVGAVRAEEEQQEVAPPARKSFEVLPAPMKAAPCCAASCCQECGSSCKCCSKCCNHAAQADPKKYSITTKFVDAGPDGDCDEITSPKVTVFEGQTASFIAHGEQTPTEHRHIAMQLRVTKQGKLAKLALGMVDQKEYINPPAGAASMAAAATNTELNVTFGKTKRLVLTKHANGSDASWVEVTVNEVTPMDDEDGSALDYVGEVVDDLIDTVSDVATTLFGDDDAEVEQAAFPTPTSTAAAPLAFPVPATAPCPMCKQCVAVEATTKRVKKIRVVMTNGQKCVECSDGDKNWKMTADRITVHDGNLDLEGNLHIVSNDGDGKIVFGIGAKVSLKTADLEIQIGD